MVKQCLSEALLAMCSGLLQQYRPSLLQHRAGLFLAALRDKRSVCTLGAMGLDVRMKEAAGEKLLLAAHSSYEMYVLSLRNFAQLPVLATGFWDTGHPDTRLASIASSKHTFTAASS